MRKVVVYVTLLSCLHYAASSDLYQRSIPNSCERAIFPEPPCCGVGKINTLRISRGVEAEKNEFPWMVYMNDCGASLINSQWILSAAHCLEDFSKGTVVLGGHYCRNRKCEPNAEKMHLKRVFVHKGWRSFRNNAYNDIALAQLEKPVIFSDTIKPICLPFGVDQNFVGKYAIVSGWGYDEENKLNEHLLKTFVQIWNPKECYSFKKWKQLQLNSKHQICAGGKTESSCDGDSGGPLFLRLPSCNDSETAEAYYQIGIVSFGTKVCGQSGYPQIYANIMNYLRWIEETISKSHYT